MLDLFARVDHHGFNPGADSVCRRTNLAICGPLIAADVRELRHVQRGLALPPSASVCAGPGALLLGIAARLTRD